ncbi:ABC transporter substrate binding protein [Desulfonatronum sp. SC1]|uniref:ABC transporter substrate binding protein n=1 Tax=Desulfonatronum sp. SC1 TaxID=2109626 RepID=UPI0013048A6F|nr:ABC transporter substrate binding protein [Desulfonatronum sp. SC1]
MVNATQSFVRIAAAVVMLVCLSSPAMGEQRFSVGYLEAGPFWLFNEDMAAVNAYLDGQGWRDKVSFPEDAWLSPGWEEQEQWEPAARELMARDDLDLIIAAGTAATRALTAVNNQNTPILSISVGDPLAAGFVVSLEDSGIDNFTTRLEPDRYPRMFDMFHQVVEFEKLGLIYQDTESGRQYTNVDDARRVAERRGFEILEYDSLASESVEDCLAALRHLIQQGMDAFFIPSLNAFDWEQSDADQVLGYLRREGIATFARNGSRDVQAGALMGFSTVDFSQRGEFLARMIIRILEGVSPRSLNMVDAGTPKISFNLAVAHEIGFNPPFDLLAATDELYQDIVLPENRLVK